MKNWILIFFTGIIVSFYLFPFEFTFLKGINTKIMLAAVGAPIMLWHFIRMQSLLFSKEVLMGSFLAIIFSIACFFATDYNNTDDYSYATYIVSMSVWLLAAYTCITLISIVHGYIDFRLLVFYLMAVCAVQCILALVIDFNDNVKQIVDQYVSVGGLTEFLNERKRLYGIGAALDFAGGRFSAVLIMAGYLLAHDTRVKEKKSSIYFLFLSFFIISVVGNMIARSTSVGMLMGLGYLFFMTGFWQANKMFQNFKIWEVILLTLLVFIPTVVYLYNNIPEIYNLMRFAFEGFFKFVETGSWKTDSTDLLMTMYVYPETLKTWVIGDGLFNGPDSSFYMETDVGYLRFIFYAGLIGLFLFIVYFIYLTIGLGQRFPYLRGLFLLFLVLTFVNWLKVSTDSFLMYSLFLAMGSPYIFTNYHKTPDRL